MAILRRQTDTCTFNSWLLTILKNTYINNYRKSVREKTCYVRTKDEVILRKVEESVYGTPDSEILCTEINKIIDDLKDENRIPFKMHISGYKYKEISETLNVNIGTVKSSIFFARKKLIRTLPGFNRRHKDSSLQISADSHQ